MPETKKGMVLVHIDLMMQRRRLNCTNNYRITVLISTVQYRVLYEDID